MARNRLIFPLEFAGLLLLAGCSSDDAQAPPNEAPENACDAAEVLQFQETDGDGETAIENHFYRQGPMAAHMLARAGRSLRLLFAFPASNQGAGIWFEDVASPAQFGVTGDSKLGCVKRGDGMRGLSAHLRSNATSLKVHGSVLGNVRSLRDYGYNNLKFKEPIPVGMIPEMSTTPPPGSTSSPSLLLRRTMTDGRHHVELSIVPEDGTTITMQGSDVTFAAGAHGEIRIFATALADDAPVTPYAHSELVKDEETAKRDNPRALQALSFLAYKEKFMAGSWRFLTYFGRDTMLSLGMLMPVLQAPLIESGIGSVLDRLGTAGAESGDVAHEEAIGDYAALTNVTATPRPADLEQPLLDYKMIDDDFELAPIAAAYFDTPEGSARAAAFLSKRTPSGATYAEALKRNLALVLQHAQPYADQPSATTLVKIRDTVNGQKNNVGNWRDSDNGLGLGRFAFDVNAALVPAALAAAKKLYARPEIADAAAAAKAEQLGVAWKGVEKYFKVTLPAANAKQRVDDYARLAQIDPKAPTDSVKGDVTYYALSLGADGKPVEVMHSDSSFMFFFTDPSAEYLESAADDLLRPFPAGLLTPVGVVVANAALATDPALQAIFTPRDYHGTVIWSWQQAMLAAGLRRQLARADLGAPTKEKLRAAEAALWAAIAVRRGTTGELWSFAAKNGAIEYAPFVIPGVDESNAVQLWSTVYLAVKPPR
ncbi:hypothetical protein LZC95_00195 [Pendulispora brunnea]|uniref:Lipoprotein n=1 Tax=Pendulispora brunnea TaxID=2905690 RepID=A0ABZ2KEG3_9BACT